MHSSSFYVCLACLFLYFIRFLVWRDTEDGVKLYLGNNNTCECVPLDMEQHMSYRRLHFEGIQEHLKLFDKNKQHQFCTAAKVLLLMLGITFSNVHFSTAIKTYYFRYESNASSTKNS